MVYSVVLLLKYLNSEHTLYYVKQTKDGVLYIFFALFFNCVEKRTGSDSSNVPATVDW